MSQQYQKCHLFNCILHLSLPNLIEEKMWSFEVLQIFICLKGRVSQNIFTDTGIFKV